jgi:tRNA (guanine-N7-)-methyltransferase
MGRRALRKIDSVLDPSRWLISLDDLPLPWDDRQVFGRPGPLEIDVGSGKGLFLSSASGLHPETNFLGIEIAARYARHAAARLASKQIDNARVLHGDAGRFFREHLRSGSVAAVHVYFPDPWWKARHKKRRVMNRSFVAEVERALAAGGTLHFWTDVEEYFRSTLELIAEFTSLSGPLPVAVLAAQHDLDYRTHFERRMRLGGLPVYRAEFRKPADDGE